jgi:aspartyl aminopeptidase
MMLAMQKTQTATELGTYIDASTSPYHAVQEAAERLEAAGFRELAEEETWQLEAGSYYVRRAGSLVAFHVPAGVQSGAGLRVIGAHTDSPNLRVKPRANTGSAGVRQLGVEVYGGALLNSWLDRDLGLSGRVIVRTAEGGQRTELFRFDEPLLRVPQLAIHLDREINTKGLLLNKQKHMAPMWGLGGREERGFEGFLEKRLGLEAGALLGWDAMTHDLTPSRLIGRESEFLAAPRLDNLCSSYTALAALLDLVVQPSPPRTISMIALFDHEEVGSESATGAAGPLLGTMIERVLIAATGSDSREDLFRSLAASVCCSADMAHATHPNYAERHEPDHNLAMNAGPVIKINANLRYATNGESEVIFQRACERAEVPFQKWVNRTDLACGSTIGSITAAKLGILTVDVGCAQLSMHSAREVCGSEDPGMMRAAMAAFLAE